MSSKHSSITHLPFWHEKEENEYVLFCINIFLATKFLSLKNIYLYIKTQLLWDVFPPYYCLNWIILLLASGASLVAQERICLQCRRCRFDPWVWKIPWTRKWQPPPVFLPGKSQGQRILVGYTVHGVQRVWHDLATKSPPLLLAPMCRHMSKLLSKFIKTRSCLTNWNVTSYQTFKLSWPSSLKKTCCFLCWGRVVPPHPATYLSFYFLFKSVFPESGRLQNLDYFSL